MSHSLKVLRAELSVSQQSAIKSIYLDIYSRGTNVREGFVRFRLDGYSNYIAICNDLMNLSEKACTTPNEVYLYDIKLLNAKFENLIALTENSGINVFINLTNCLIKSHSTFCSIINDIIEPYNVGQ